LLASAGSNGNVVTNPTVVPSPEIAGRESAVNGADAIVVVVAAARS